MNIKKLKDKRILILGFGREGQDTYKFLRQIFPNKIFGVGDREKNLKIKIRNLKFINWHLGKDYLKAIKNYDLIIKSPGIPIHLPEIEKAFEEKKITSQAEIFLENCPAKIIGITGTKGKGTTALLIYQVLKETGKKVYLVGNIGKPALSLLNSLRSNDFVVYELSAQQLYKIKKSPSIAVLLNIYPAHLDYFKNFKEYLEAKANICRYQKEDDILIYNSAEKNLKKIIKISKAQKIPFSKDSILLKKILRRTKISLVGDFNFVNLSACLTLAKLLKIDEKKIIRALKSFKNQPHRLEYIGTFKGIKFYDDSAATIPESTIGAIDTFKKNLQTLILGGFENKVPFLKLSHKIIKSQVKNLIFFPPSGEKIWKDILKIKPKNKFNVFFVESMAKAVKIAYSQTKKGRICLLSPACPSFGIFKDYQERGRLFKKYVKLYGKRE
jgi:UDP-N-acetylmuramoylalanine--D-glutamate ligase